MTDISCGLVPLAVESVSLFGRVFTEQGALGEGGGAWGEGDDRKAARRAVPVRRLRSLTGIDSRATPSRARA